MATLEFDPEVESLRRQAASMTNSADRPDFDGARGVLGVAYDRLSGGQRDDIHVASQVGRVLCDEGLVDLREGLALSEPDTEIRGSSDPLELVGQGEERVRRSLELTAGLLAPDDRLAADSQLAHAVRANHALTLQYHLRAQQIGRIMAAAERGVEPAAPSESERAVTAVLRDEVARSLRYHIEPLEVVRACEGMVQYERADDGRHMGRRIARWLLEGGRAIARDARANGPEALLSLLDLGAAVDLRAGRMQAIGRVLQFEHLR
jgi:hypothetical protein